MNREVHNEHETLDKDEQAVSRLVAGLKHVEAPANFERRVMGKISEGRPQRRGFLALSTIAYTVPALLVILVATFFIFKLRQPTPAQIETVVANAPTKAETVPPVNLNQTPEPGTVAQGSPEGPQLPDKNKRASVRPRMDANLDKGGGSYDETVREKKRPMPEGLDNSSPSSANRNEVITQTRIPLNEVLEVLGMSADAKSQWRVTSVRENSPSAKSGVKVGDVITALDDQDINAGNGFNNSGSVRVITVLRDGKRVPLKVAGH